MNEEQYRHEIDRLREQNAKLHAELNSFDEENQKLKNKLKSFEKGVQRPVYDMDALASYPALAGSLYSIQDYGPWGNGELLSKLGTIVRRALFADETVKEYRRPRGRNEKVQVDVAPRLSDINDMQYRYYLTALDRVFEALSDTVTEYREERKHKEKNT